MDLSIFVSSPSEDLRVVRERLCEYVEKRGFRPSSMDTIVTNLSSPLGLSLAALGACDYYIGLLGFRYGSEPPPEENPQKLSFTELEYREAKRLGKDFAWFLLNREYRKTHRESSWKQLAVENLRREITSKYYVPHFTDWEDLKPKIARQLDAWVDKRRLEVELERRYPGSRPRKRFMVVQSPHEEGSGRVFEAAARLLLSEIRRGLQKPEHGAAEPFVVGVAGGRAHCEIVRHLEAERSLLTDEDFSRVKFVALNSAAMPEHYERTANYLVTRLSQIFPKAQHVACLPDPGRQHGAYDRLLTGIDLLLGGAGGTGGGSGFLKKWLASRGGNLELPESMVGDFCYVPVDRDGNALVPSASTDRTLKALADLNVRLRFRRLADVRTPSIIPLLGQPQSDDDAAGTLTNKGEIGDVVLARINVVHCVLDERTAAELLSYRLCGYVLGRCLGSDHAGGALFEATPPGASATVVLRVIHQTDQRHREPPAPANLKPDAELLISDPPGEFNPTKAHVFVKWHERSFAVKKGVRRPGLWSATLARVGAELVAGRSHLSVLDMGCGTGAVGYLASELADCERVTFVDIKADAVDNAKANHALFTRNRVHFQFVRSDLFSHIPDAYDLVLFSPPFIPAIKGVRTDQPVADKGGWFGSEVGEYFARTVSDHLRPGGFTVIALASYVQHHELASMLRDHGLTVEERRTPVMYPQKPAFGWKQSYEIRNRELLESRVCRDLFRDEFRPDETEPSGFKHYVAFEMVHIIGHKPV
jgi:methylase of polypeptide subunit release factors